MGLDCKMTVLGSKNGGSRQHGATEQDRTKTVVDFIVGSEVLYRAVFAHVKDCGKCDPQEVLEAYLSDRKRPKLGGLTSNGLCVLAEKYKKHFPGKVKDETVREFYWRIGTVGGLLENASFLSPEEMISGILVMYRMWLDSPKSFREDWARRELQAAAAAKKSPYAEIFAGLIELKKSGPYGMPDRTELLNLATVAYVLGS